MNRTTLFALLSAFAFTAFTAACVGPMSMRGAEVLDPGQFELGAGSLATSVVGKGSPIPAVGGTASGRVGLGADLDLQLQLTSTITNTRVEVMLARELFTTKTFVFTAGLGLSGEHLLAVAIPGRDLFSAHVPITGLVDARLSESTTLTLEAYAAPGASLQRELRVLVGSRASVALAIPLGDAELVLRPGVGIEMPITRSFEGVRLVVGAGIAFRTPSRARSELDAFRARPEAE